jgi:predicted DNA-binding WGR domain protein
MIFLNRIDPHENLNRWYLVSIQATLFHPCAVVIAWGRRDNAFQQWRAIPVESAAQAQELADRIVTKKIKKGYSVCPSNRHP